MPHDKADAIIINYDIVRKREPDILADYRQWRSMQEDRIGTHSPDCHLWPRHERCMIHRLAVEVERLRQGAVEWRDQLEIAADEVERLRQVLLQKSDSTETGKKAQ